MIKLDISKEEIDIFTDGSCSGNPGPGGWAVVAAIAMLELVATVACRRPGRCRSPP